MKKILKEVAESNETIDANTEVLKKIKINNVYYNITRICWKYDTQYLLLYKDKEIMEMILRGFKYQYYFKFEKSGLVDFNHVEKFKKKVKELNVSKGIYIITGKFDSKVKMNRYLYFLRKIWLIDGKMFLKTQKSLNEMNFYRYIPK
ncbi:MULTISPECIES: hypothetical protein [Clostridium]|uniref:Uncharacterized protein n=1 Tax=Clostridium cadaveris TaxID=1529 RepID=A0A1I2L9Q4_9CLOT|nr:hypothetical protein [Clostridium cadaveris]MDU4951658.1 hypothetical protein [Clostridium sp.]MDM8312629.1 hypothetical protein [Clostridium cadaveris]NWK09602.1 hypothetical protein [Clostridium cadaveris]PWL52469.1 MAG: hypothetical protein DBY38_11100 [Clostridium cadaveris]UFH64367.1 hypothetical protein KQH81_13935 [Clostridium cadaveris]